MPLLKAKAKKNNITHKDTQKSGGSELNRAAALFIIFKKSTISAQK